jgi:hypothetical protein
MARIDAEVERLLGIMHPQQDGGYIFAAAHNLQNDVTPASIGRVYRAALQAQRPKKG